MKIGGVEVNGPNEEILVLPRLDQDIVIRARAVSDMTGFEAVAKVPKAPGKYTKNGFEPTLDDVTYLQKVEQFNSLRMAYMILRSLEPSEIEWENVDMENPKTWLKWDEELRASGLSDIEINRIVMCVMQANSLDESKLQQAREVFLLGLEVEGKSISGHQIAPESTPSGEPAPDSESDPQA